MKFVYAAIASLFFTTTAFAQQYFFNQQNLKGYWDVTGYSGDSTLNPTCKLTKRWNDGSTFDLIKDLKDGELYILFINNSWNISDPPNSTATARMNFQTGNNIKGAGATFELLNKNTIRFRDISVDRFLPDFVDARKLVIIMPGTIQNVEVDLTGTSDAIQVLSACVKSFKANRTVKPGIDL